jgi:hypothetical protein
MEEGRQPLAEMPMLGNAVRALAHRSAAAGDRTARGRQIVLMAAHDISNHAADLRIFGAVGLLQRCDLILKRLNRVVSFSVSLDISRPTSCAQSARAPLRTDATAMKITQQTRRTSISPPICNDRSIEPSGIAAAAITG